jgi:hypothetical protein
MRIHRHMGLGYEVWNGHGSWFWRVVYPPPMGGTIGAAGNEAEASREARRSIEEARGRCEAQAGSAAGWCRARCP